MKAQADSVDEFLSWLFSMGLIFNDDDLDKESRHMDEHFLKMHPLLPYLLRYVMEVTSPERPEILKRYRTFQKLFWKFYETRLSRVTRDRAYQNARCTAYARDIENIMNAIVVSMEQEVFGKRALDTIETIMFHPEIQQLLSQRQTQRLYRVLKDCSIRYHMMSTDTMPKDVLEQAFRIVHFIALHPSEKQPPGHSHPNIERGEHLLQVAQSRFPEEDFTVACEMWCKVHKFFARGPLTAGNYDEVKDLVLKSTPCDDLFWKDVFIGSQMDMTFFIAGELPSAAFPVEPFKALIAQFTTKIETTFLKSFGDPQLCSAAISLYTAWTAIGERSEATAKVFNSLADSNVIDMFPKARRYLASEWYLGMDQRKELSVFERALEFTLEDHDKVTEFFVQDALFRKRVDLDEKEAAVQHNERLQVLEREIQATSFEPSSRGRIGLRHLETGSLYLQLVYEPNSRQPDLESKARNCLKGSLKYLEGLPDFGEAKYIANYTLSTLCRKARMHKESLQHAAAIVQLERGPDKDDLPHPRYSFEKGEFLWHYGQIWTSEARANEDFGLKPVHLDVEDAIASTLGWYPIYFREFMCMCLQAIGLYIGFEGEWATCPASFKKFLWGAQEILFASDVILAQKMVWPVSSDRRASQEEDRAWIGCVAESPAEDVLNRLVELTSSWPRMTEEESEGGA